MADAWSKDHPDEEDPLGEPEAVAETPAPEPEPVEAGPEEETPAPEPEPIQAETPEPEPSPEATDEEQADWKRRHDALRDTQRRTAEERNEANRQRDEALALARQVWEQSQKLQQPPTPAVADPNVEAMRREAADLGITDEQFAFMQKMQDAVVSEKVGAVQTQFTQNQEEQRQAQYLQRVADERMTVVNSFRASHPDAKDLEDDIFEVLREVGMVNERNEFDQPELRIDHLEVALEAAKDPALRKIFRANPVLYDTDDGVDFARQQAALAQLLAKAQPVTSSTLADSEAAVAAAETLPASGGPPPGTGGPPGDEFDKVLEYDKKLQGSHFR